MPRALPKSGVLRPICVTLYPPHPVVRFPIQKSRAAGSVGPVIYTGHNHPRLWIQPINTASTQKFDYLCRVHHRLSVARVSEINGSLN